MPISDAGVAVLDCEHKTPHAQIEGHPYIAIPDIRDGRVELANARRISTSDLGLWTRRTTPLPGDILVTRRGRVGDTAPIPADTACAVGQNLVLLRSDERLVRQDYLRWAVRSPQWWAEVDRLMNVGAVFSSLNVRDIARLRIPIPTLPEQQAIAEVLGALDDKIAANIKLADSSFGLAQILFTEAKKQSGRQEAVGAIATTVLGGTPSRAVPEYWAAGTVPWLNSGKANEDRITIPSEYITEEALARSAAKLMPEGSTVIAITGATLGQVARLEIAASGNQSLVGIWSDKPAMNDWLHFAIRDNISELLKRSTGAAQQHVNKRDVDALVIPVVSESELDKFGSRVGPLLNIAANTDRQSSALAILRDALLPELMSGRLRVKDAEKKIEEVV